MTDQLDIRVSRQNNLTQPLHVLITGSSSGIGLAQVKAFLTSGHQVLGLDIKTSYETEILQKDYPTSFSFFQADVTEVDHIESIIEGWLVKNTYLNVLCNTAGILDNYANLAETSLVTWTHIMQTNVTSQFIVTKLCLPYLIDQPSSRVINMASIAGLTAGGGGIAYTAAKHAIVGFTKQLAYDYAKEGLRANAIAPGAINTPMNAADFQENNGQMAYDVADQTPVKRWADASEVADLTLFLASDQADYMQGNIIPLDGGWLIR